MAKTGGRTIKLRLRRNDVRGIPHGASINSKTILDEGDQFTPQLGRRSIVGFWDEEDERLLTATEFVHRGRHHDRHIEDRAGDRTAVDEHAGFGGVPAAGSNNDRVASGSGDCVHPCAKHMQTCVPRFGTEQVGNHGLMKFDWRQRIGKDRYVVHRATGHHVASATPGATMGNSEQTQRLGIERRIICNGWKNEFDTRRRRRTVRTCVIWNCCRL